MSTYLPSAVLLPMQTKRDQFHVSGQIGPGGFQLNGSYAANDHIVVRAIGHAQTRSDGYFRLGSGGVGYQAAFGPPPEGQWEGLRLGISLDFGVAGVRGAEVVQREITEAKLFYSGMMYRTALQGECGFETTYLEGALALRAVHVFFEHDEASDVAADRTANWLSFEPVLVLRGGFEDLKLELQGGLSLPAVREGTFGQYRTVFGTAGFVADFD